MPRFLLVCLLLMAITSSSYAQGDSGRRGTSGSFNPTLFQFGLGVTMF